MKVGPGRRDLRPPDPGTRDTPPSQSLKVRPDTPLIFKIESPTALPQSLKVGPQDPLQSLKVGPPRLHHALVNSFFFHNI